MEAFQVIAVEGPSYAGKSTLLRALDETGAITYIPELPQPLADGTRRLEPFPFASAAAARSGVDRLIGHEAARQAFAKLQPPRRPMVFDRSVLSVLTFHRLLAERYPEYHNAYDYGLEAVSHALAAGDLALPARLLVLRPRCRQDFSDRQARATSASVLSDYETCRHLSRQYVDIARAHPSAMVMISGNGPRSLRHLCERAYAFLAQPQPVSVPRLEELVGQMPALAKVGQS
jgi:hypothetical protein